MRPLSSIAIAAVLIATAATSPAAADVRCGPGAAPRVGVAPPPPLPQTDQPPMPAYGYVWTPGSWSWNQDVNDYYWTPGAWVLPPAIGLFWTPGYWGWDDGDYLYHGGYWGPHVGFYGGIDYGFGYWGHGYDGGYWQGRTFYYNRNYNNVGGLHINALYNHRDPGDRQGRRTSYNGGPGGIIAAARADDRLADRDKHISSTADQQRRSQSAAGDRSLRASVNHGQPRLAGAAPAGRHMAAAHGEGSRPEAVRSVASHDRAGHATFGHGAAGHVQASHFTHAAPAHRRQEAVQPRRESYGHFAPAGREPSFAHSQPSRAEPRHFESPHQGPGREGAPHEGGQRGGDSGRPHH
jgi:hypothetical protein